MIVVKIWQAIEDAKNMVINWRWFCFGLIVQKVPVFFTASLKCYERLNVFGQKKKTISPPITSIFLSWLIA